MGRRWHPPQAYLSEMWKAQVHNFPLFLSSTPLLSCISTLEASDFLTPFPCTLIHFIACKQLVLMIFKLLIFLSFSLVQWIFNILIAAIFITVPRGGIRKVHLQNCHLGVPSSSLSQVGVKHSRDPDVVLSDIHPITETASQQTSP